MGGRRRKSGEKGRGRTKRGEGKERLLTSVSDVSDIVVLEVQDPLGVFDNGTSIGSDEELDGLRHAIVREEGSRLSSSDVAVARRGGNREHRDVLVVDCRRADEAKRRQSASLKRDSEEDKNEREASRLTKIKLVRVGSDLDVDEIDLELLVGLDSDEKRGSSSSEDDLGREVNGLEEESEGSFL